MAPFQNKIEAGSVATAVREFHKVWGEGEWDDLSSEDQGLSCWSASALCQRATLCCSMTARGSLAPGRLEELDMPVTFVDGGDSHPAMAEIISTIGDRIPDAEWVTVPGRGICCR